MAEALSAKLFKHASAVYTATDVTMTNSKRSTIIALLALASLAAPAVAQSTTPLTTALTTQLCAIVFNVEAVTGILALALFLLGGSIYAFGHFLPSTLDYRKSLMGWSMAMVTGGLIGLVVVLAAPQIVGIILNIASSTITASCGAPGSSSSSTTTIASGNPSCSSQGASCKPASSCTAFGRCIASSDCPGQNQLGYCCCKYYSRG